MPPQYLEDGSVNLHSPKTNELGTNAAGTGKGKDLWHKRLTEDTQCDSVLCSSRVNFETLSLFVTPVEHALIMLLPLGVSSSSTTLHERYSSPTTGTARRRLFVDSEMTSDPPASSRVSQPSLVSTIPAGQTVVTMATATVTANNGQTVTIPVQGAVSFFFAVSAVGVALVDFREASGTFRNSN